MATVIDESRSEQGHSQKVKESRITASQHRKQQEELEEIDQIMENIIAEEELDFDEDDDDQVL